MTWYLRSLSDADTHRGVLESGAVFALCGATFPPLPLAYGTVALLGGPADPGQICPRCYRATVTPPTRQQCR